MGGVASQPARDLKNRLFQRQQGILRAFAGVPLVISISALSYVPVVFALLRFWAFVAARVSDEQAFSVFFVLSPWVFNSVLFVSKVVVAVAVKRCIVGPLHPGAKAWAHGAEFRHWLHARMVESHDFEEVCGMLVNTEALSCIYRLLGATIGRRVQIDSLHVVEHDCLHVEDYVVFGSEILMSCDARAPWTPQDSGVQTANLGLERIHLHTSANALDHCTFLPGARVGERSVLGSCSLASHRSYFTPSAIYTGSVQGRASYLRDYTATKALRAQEDRAMRDLDDPWVWWMFNAYLHCVALIAMPLPEVTWVLTFLMVSLFFDLERDQVGGLLIFVVPFIHFAIALVDLLMLVVIKWAVVGRFKAGECRFFSSYHYRWMTMMTIGGGAGELTAILEGTVFNAWFYRANGATVGRSRKRSVAGQLRFG